MYGWFWRHLPGNVLVKALTSLLLAVGIVYLLFQHVFPWAEPLVPFGDATVNGGGTSNVQPSDSSAPGTPAPGSPAPGSSAPGSSETTLNGAAAPSTVVNSLSFRVPNTGAPQV